MHLAYEIGPTRCPLSSHTSTALCVLLFKKDKLNAYDVVIVDSSDPVGPAETLFTSSFYAGLRKAMRPGAIMCDSPSLNLFYKVSTPVIH